MEDSFKQLEDRLNIEVATLKSMIDMVKGTDYDYTNAILKDQSRLLEKLEKDIIRLTTRLDLLVDEKEILIEPKHSAQELRELYERSGVSLRVIADNLGCSISATSKLINGMVNDESKRRQAYMFLKEQLILEGAKK